MTLRRDQRVYGKEFSQAILLNKDASKTGVDQPKYSRGCQLGERRRRFWIVLIVLLALVAAAFLPWLFHHGK